MGATHVGFILKCILNAIFNSILYGLFYMVIKLFGWGQSNCLKEPIAVQLMQMHDRCGHHLIYHITF